MQESRQTNPLHFAFALAASTNGMDTSQIQFRSFHNTDPPKLVKLWLECGLGRGAADDLTCDAFEQYVLSQPYFEKAGLIVAELEGNFVGYAHAGFGCNQSETSLCHEAGSICAVMVSPQHRRRGIGRQLVSHAEQFLRDSGANRIYFGAAAPRNPFYVGMYGGSEPAGFLESDENVIPFAQALGLVEVERLAIFQRNMNDSRDPIGLRLMRNKRRYQLRLEMVDSAMSWWWTTRFGRLDSVTAILEPKSGGTPVAHAKCYGLDLYISKWGQRAVGIGDVLVPDEHRRSGYAQTLLVELCNRMKRELVTLIDAQATESDAASIELLRSSGFSRVDTGIVFGRPELVDGAT
jgi:ribosomal protein S18 acetylase RimI-like enzyme